MRQWDQKERARDAKKGKKPFKIVYKKHQNNYKYL